jgi:phosphate transport system substrate-binding protein
MIASLMVAVLCGAADVPAAAAQMPPVVTASATVRIWGNPEMVALVAAWQAGLRRRHPQLTITTHLTGSDVAMAGLYTGQADIALLGREATASELKAFEWVFRFPPTAVEIATGSLATAGKSPALVVSVHRDNPLAALSLTQLDAIFGHERLLGASRPIDHWGALGLGGEWATQPINLYLYDTESGSGRDFRKVALADSRALNWERIQEFTDSGAPAARTHDADVRILDALAHDRYGIAVSSLAGANDQVRGLALSAGHGTPAVAASRVTLIGRSYPLTRVAIAYVGRTPGAAVDAHVATVLRYALSAAGQRRVERDGGYLPLRADIARRQREALE